MSVLKLKEIAKYKIAEVLTFIGNNSVRNKTLPNLVLHNLFPAYHMQQSYFYIAAANGNYAQIVTPDRFRMIGSITH